MPTIKSIAPTLGGIQLPSSVVSGRSLRQLLVVGNSYARAEGGAATAGASAVKYRYSLAVANRFGAAEHNIAVNGAYMHRPHLVATGDGGYADIVQGYVPSRTAMPALSDIDAAILSTGLNDCGLLGSANLAPWTEATRRVICRLRAGAVFEDTDASVAYDANWTQNNQTYRNSGTSTHTTLAVGAQVTITVPAWFAGGEIDLACILINGFVSNAAVTVDGTQADSFSFASSFVPSAAGYTGMVRRLTGLAPGAHTIVITTTAGNTALAFDGWEMCAQSPPIVVHPLQPRLATPGTNTQDSDIATLNGLIKSLGSTFTDGRVINPDIDTPLGKNAAYFNGGSLGGGGDHPNDEGHQIIAGVLSTSLGQALALYGNENPAAGAPLWHNIQASTGTPPYNEPLFQNSWVNAGVAGYSSAGFRRSSNGRVSLRGLIKGGAAASTAFTLPDGCRPSVNLVRETAINNGAGPVFGGVSVLSSGAVQPAASGTTWTSLDGIEFDAA